MLKYSVNYIGPLFDKNLVESKLKYARRRTLEQAVDIVQRRTPVVSGDLRNAWETDKESIFNDMYYSGYVEDGTRFFEGRFMLRNSLPEIEDAYINNLIKIL